MESKPLQRRYDLDWLRVLAILAIFVFHSSRLFDTDDWSIKNPTVYAALDVWKEFAMTWGMPLILLISGASVFYALEKVRVGAYLKGLFARLFLPLAVGIFTHVAFQVYLEDLQKGSFKGSFWQFYPHYFDGMYGFGGNFAWMGLHLWYLEMLFIFSLFFLPFLLWLKKSNLGRAVLQASGNILAKPGAVFLLALPAIVLIIKLDPETWGNPDLGGWSVLIYPFFFLSGFVIVSSQPLQTRICEMRWLSLVLGFSLSPVYLFLEFQTRYPALSLLTNGFVDPLRCLVAWSWLLAVLGFGIQHLNFNTPFLKYANEAVLPFYILHQTVIVVLGYFLVQWEIPGLLKFVIILISSFLVIMGLYEFGVRRFNLMRFLFGMKLLKPVPTQIKETQREKAAPTMSLRVADGRVVSRRKGRLR